MPTENKPTFLAELTFDQIKEGLQQTFPALMPRLGQLQFLNDGFSSYVVLMADEIILRIARHAEAMAGYMKEQSILPLLQKYLPVQIPQPILWAGPSDVFPFGVMGYRRISGIPLSLNLVPNVALNRVAQDLARFLVALHNVSLAEVSPLGFMENPGFEKLWMEVVPTLQMYLAEDEYEKIRMWCERYLGDNVKDSFTPRLIHGDPWGENIILNETLRGVVGVIDFETVAVGDVAQDFAAQKYLGKEFLSQIIELYQSLGGELGHHFTLRLQDWSMVRELRGLHYAIKYPASGELVDALQKVRNELNFFA
jgi:aminoglycoside phosphotransferase (APT) family kinase protein